jgi:hypothetical protein
MLLLRRLRRGLGSVCLRVRGCRNGGKCDTAIISPRSLLHTSCPSLSVPLSFSFSSPSPHSPAGLQYIMDLLHDLVLDEHVKDDDAKLTAPEVRAAACCCSTTAILVCSCVGVLRCCRVRGAGCSLCGCGAPRVGS